ncbi:hypothetical protein [Chryseobacterium lathyri]|uniref:Uncharacterized protein n=1 Tax=Chryseobacterium lathyri TaxID=395933 RepID=A0A511YFU9_9FLAO|nr:hypothetical protein [Chryseobacterium lathyri]GEN74072.1 hypothetical protein CLA01_41440 [Chryseobacterium lathyri]
MSTEAQQIANQIENETQAEGNSKVRVASGFKALDRDKAEIDGSNLTPENIQSWKNTLEINGTEEQDTLDTVAGRDPITTKSITIGGLKATSLNNADATYTKNVVAKPDGTIGWENKTSIVLPFIPKVEIHTYEQDASNYYMNILVSGMVGSITSPYFRIFSHSGTGTDIEASGVTVVSQVSTGTVIMPGNISANSMLIRISFSKSANTSLLWSSASTSVMISAEFLGTHNSDVANGTTYSIPRVGIDTKLKQKISI